MIIKYLIQDLDINVNQTNEYFDPSGGIRNHYKDTCLTMGCLYNPNLRIIEYLIQDVKMNIYHLNYWSDNCLDQACENNNNVEIIKYLIQETKVPLSIKKMSFPLFKTIIPDLKNYHRLNLLLKLGFEKYERLPLICTIIQFNPIILDKNILKLANLNDPFDDSFDHFINNVNKITNQIPIDIMIKDKSKKRKHEYDHKPKSEILFELNGFCYHGNRRIVYESMYIFKDLISDDCFDFKNTIVLDVQIPGYIVNLYLESCYYGIFDMNDIGTDDLISFIKFIDQYPSNVLSIHLLENEIIEYLDQHQITPNDYLMSICTKYQLKNLYIYIHNQSIVKN